MLSDLDKVKVTSGERSQLFLGFRHIAGDPTDYTCLVLQWIISVFANWLLIYYSSTVL